MAKGYALVGPDGNPYDTRYPTMGHAIEASLIEHERFRMSPEDARERLLQAAAEIKRLDREIKAQGDRHATREKMAFWLGFTIVQLAWSVIWILHSRPAWEWLPWVR